MEIISVNKLGKSFGKKELFSNLSFSIDKGDIVAIVGPNGCGKTTILNILTGLISKTEGEIIMPKFDSKNQFSYIFQNYRSSLLPWKTNYENIVLPMSLQKKTEKEIEKKISELKKMFDLDGQLHMYPYEMSGGQQQIIAFMRALVNEPKIIFIDEPFSALDYANNLILRKHLLEYHSKYVPTIVIITHNIEEAVHLANKIIVFSSNPTKISEIIENNVPYPRKLEFLNSKGFFDVKQKVLTVFKKGVKL